MEDLLFSFVHHSDCLKFRNEPSFDVSFIFIYFLIVQYRSPKESIQFNFVIRNVEIAFSIYTTYYVVKLRPRKLQRTAAGTQSSETPTGNSPVESSFVPS